MNCNVINKDHLPLLFKVFNENRWMPPFHMDGKYTEFDLSDICETHNFNYTYLCMAEKELAALSPEDFQAFMGETDPADNDMAKLEAKIPTAVNLANIWSDS